MKPLLHIIALFVILIISAYADAVDIEGDFSPDIEKSIKWMVDNKHPITLVDGKTDMNRVKRYKEAAYKGDPLIHRWRNGKAKVQVTKEWIIDDARTWKKTSDTTYISIIPADDSNTELSTTIKIIDKNNYYIEITVNNRVTREYFTRRKANKNGEQGGAHQSTTRSESKSE